MIKKLIIICIVFLFLFCTSYLASAAESPMDAIAKNKIKLKEINDSIIATNKKISDLNANMDNVKITINKNNTDINKTEEEIKDAESQLEPLKKEIESSQNLANSRIRATYINDYGKSTIILLLSSKNLSDLFLKYDAMNRIMQLDKKIMNNLLSNKNKLTGIISDLNLKSNELKQLKDSNENKFNQLRENKEQLDNLIKQFDEEKKSADLIIKQNEELLIAHSVSVIDSESSTINDVRTAIETLKGLVPQLSTDTVKETANQYISSGNVKLAALQAKSIKQNDNSYAGTYKATYAMSATAYTGGTLTAMGLKPVRDPSGLSTIAVDPMVLPLGTEVYIPGYGKAICSDTGGAIKGTIVDLYFDTESQCIQWGRQSVTVQVIAYPGEW